MSHTQKINFSFLLFFSFLLDFRQPVCYVVLCHCYSCDGDLGRLYVENSLVCSISWAGSHHLEFPPNSGLTQLSSYTVWLLSLSRHTFVYPGVNSRNQVNLYGLLFVFCPTSGVIWSDINLLNPPGLKCMYLSMFMRR